MSITNKAFGAYDLRGIYPAEVNEELYYRIGRTFPALFGARRVVIGHDIRLSGPALSEALAKGLREAGCDVVDIGLCGTEIIYYAAAHLPVQGGLMVTASHNPREYNGLKLVHGGAVPLSKEDLTRLETAVCGGAELPRAAGAPGGYLQQDIMTDYVAHILSYVDIAALKPFRVVANAGNGAAGPVLERLSGQLPFELKVIYGEPDGSFPHGVPNPLLPENRETTAQAVREYDADFGVAWDGDFDRCFMFDDRGEFIDGYYMVGFLAQAFLAREPGAKIIYDPRCIWNTIELVREAGGEPVICKGGHAYIKAKMREVDAVYGGEMSAHHYFRDFSYCDSGMIPWLLVAQLMSRAERPLSELLYERRQKFPVSGEINSRAGSVAEAQSILEGIERLYAEGGKVSHLDGLTVEQADWRFNLRKSNTEPLLRLNVETRGDAEMCKRKTEELLRCIRG